MAENQNYVFKLEGDFDAQCIESIRTDLTDLVEQHKENIVIDMAQVEFLDSSGIGALVFLYKRLYEGNRRMTIEGLHGQPQRLIEMLRIDQAIPCNQTAFQ